MFIHEYLISTDWLTLTTSLLFIFYKFDITLRNVFPVDLDQPVVQVIAHITLHCNLLSASRRFRDRGTRGEFLAQIFCNLLQIQSMGLQAGDHGDKFPLVPLDSLDLDFGGGLAFRIPCLGQGRLGLLLRSVFGGLFTGFDGETGEVGAEGFYRIITQKKKSLSVMSIASGDDIY